VFGLHGYRRHFFFAADPAWDGKPPWVRQWYGDYTFDRSRESDSSMFLHMADWLKRKASDGKPFMVSCLTKANHYPFNPVPGVKPMQAGGGMQDRMASTMEFADRSLGYFLEAIRHEPWFKRTVVLVIGDHGFPLSEHGSSAIGYGLYTESTWIPFVLAGTHPKLGQPGLRTIPISQMDIGPTFLELAGIREPDAYLGQSLVRPHPGPTRLVGLRKEQGYVADSSWTFHGSLKEEEREQGAELFQTEKDWKEKENLWSQSPEAAGDAPDFLRIYGHLHPYVLESNRLWPSTQTRQEMGNPPLESPSP
jgi:arylsulfatase A-like enzyme